MPYFLHNATLATISTVYSFKLILLRFNLIIIVVQWQIQGEISLSTLDTYIMLHQTKASTSHIHSVCFHDHYTALQMKNS